MILGNKLVADFCGWAFALLLCVSMVHGQSDKFEAFAVGFYNVENFFDTLDNPQINDEEFTPDGDKLWNGEKYNSKVANIASVISQLGLELCKDGVSLLGVSEIENDTVLESIINHPLLAGRNYSYVHHSSRDKRGIDVALIFDKDVFAPTNVIPFSVTKPNAKKGSRPTRDVLLVSGELDGELIHITINHWPSRSGGQKRTDNFRKAAAKVNRGILDSLLTDDPAAKLIVMGDLNDDPNNDSLTKILRAEKKTKSVEQNEMFNPMYGLFSKGLGSNAYRDKWSLFDQIVVSEPLIRKKEPGLKFHRAIIYNKKYLIQKSGEYKGYPKRTFSGNVFQSGYSDHFPVYIYLIKEV